jgi:hypothetical protein
MARQGLKKVQITGVEVRVQWEGNPEPFYEPRNSEGFPGIEVPLELVEAARRLDGRQLFVSARDYPMSCSAGLRQLFDYSAALGSQEGNVLPVLYNDPKPTNLQSPRWRPGIQALAWQAGNVELSATGSRVPGARPRPWYVSYPSANSWTLRGRFWLCFALKKVNW